MVGLGLLSGLARGRDISNVSLEITGGTTSGGPCVSHALLNLAHPSQPTSSLLADGLRGLHPCLGLALQLLLQVVALLLGIGASSKTGSDCRGWSFCRKQDLALGKESLWRQWTG